MRFNGVSWFSMGFNGKKNRRVNHGYCSWEIPYKLGNVVHHNLLWKRNQNHHSIWPWSRLTYFKAICCSSSCYIFTINHGEFAGSLLGSGRLVWFEGQRGVPKVESWDECHFGKPTPKHFIIGQRPTPSHKQDERTKDSLFDSSPNVGFHIN